MIWLWAHFRWAWQLSWIMERELLLLKLFHLRAPMMSLVLLKLKSPSITKSFLSHEHFSQKWLYYNDTCGSKVVFYSNWLFYTLFIPLPIKHANTVMTILGFTSTRSSGGERTPCSNSSSHHTAYLFFGGNKNWGSIPISQGHNMRHLFPLIYSIVWDTKLLQQEFKSEWLHCLLFSLYCESLISDTRFLNLLFGADNIYSLPFLQCKMRTI